MNKSRTKKVIGMPRPKQHLLRQPLHKRLLNEVWAFRSSLDNLPGAQYGQRTQSTWTSKNTGKKYLEIDSSRFNFIDNGADILFVAHTDSVVANPKVRADAKLIASPVLDNRIGVWLVLCELPRHGIKADVLLTEGEETGQSTAAYFNIDKQYKWIAEFDRSGFDCALYQFGNTETAKLVKEVGYKPVRGTFTDICSLGHLGAKAFNFGVAYRNYHSADAHIYTSDLEKLIKMFVSFYRKNHGKAMPHDAKTERKGGWYSAGYDSWAEDAWAYDYTAKPNWTTGKGNDRYYSGQDTYGYLGDGQGPALDDDELAKWHDLEVKDGGGTIYKLGDLAKRHGQRNQKTKLTSTQKFKLFAETIGTEAELTTVIECDVCYNEYHPGQLIVDSDNDMLLCEDCDTYLNGRTPLRLGDCDYCGQSAVKVTDCTMNGSFIVLCDYCIGDLSHKHTIHRAM